MGLLWDDKLNIGFCSWMGSAILVSSIIFSILLFHGKGKQYLPYGKETNTVPNHIGVS